MENDTIFTLIWNKVLDKYKTNNDSLYAKCCGVFFTRWKTNKKNRELIKHKSLQTISEYLYVHGIEDMDDFIRTWKFECGELLPKLNVNECKPREFELEKEVGELKERIAFLERELEEEMKENMDDVRWTLHVHPCCTDCLPLSKVPDAAWTYYQKNPFRKD